jgi:hypothetical protein
MLPLLFAQPLLHGSVGIVDELLTYCLLLVIVIIIVVRTLHRSGQPAFPRERIRAVQPISSSKGQPTKDKTL